MKKTLLALVAAAALSTSSAHAAPVLFTANLGNFENPPTGSAGTGFAAVTMDVVAHTLTIDVDFTGLTGVTTNAHIHCCIAAPGNIGVATTTPTFPGFPAGVTAGSYFNIFDTTLASSFNAAFITAASPAGTVANAEARLFSGLLLGQAYFNIHTNLSPGGEIRGFLVETAVPEPTSLSLLGLGIAGAVLLRRRRRS